MCCLVLGAMLFPRLTLVVLYLFTTFVHRAVPAPDLLYAAVGFFLAPVSFLWYCAVANWYGGSWGLLQIVVLLICLAIDFSAGGGAERERRARRRRLSAA